MVVFCSFIVDCTRTMTTIQRLSTHFTFSGNWVQFSADFTIFIWKCFALVSFHLNEINWWPEVYLFVVRLPFHFIALYLKLSNSILLIPIEWWYWLYSKIYNATYSTWADCNRKLLFVFLMLTLYSSLIDTISTETYRKNREIDISLITQN